MQEAQKRFLVVSIHDVSPLTWHRVRTILEALDGIGIHKRSLLVIPNHQGKAAIEHAEPEFQSWLRILSQQDEVCLHGYRHQAQTLRGGPWARLVATCYTNREGEFYQLTAEEATRQLRKGREHLGNLEIRPTGFIAPAWLLSPQAEAAVHEAGFQYTTRLRSIDILTPPPRRLRAPVLCYSTRRGWRRALSRLWNRTLFALEQRSPVLRAAIHPPDVDHAAIFRQLLSLLRRASADRTVASYQEVVEYYSDRTDPTQ